MRRIYIYILECHDGRYYIGITNDVEKRLTDHQIGIDPKSYTYTRRPVSLMYKEEHESPEEAISREKQLKRWSHAKKKALIEGKKKILGKLSWNRSGKISVKPDSAGYDMDSAGSP